MVVSKHFLLFTRYGSAYWLVFLSLRPIILHDEAVNSMKSWWKKVQDQKQPSGQLGHGLCMQVGISYRCTESYQDEGFAGNPCETAYRKMYQCLCSLLAGRGAEAPFGGDKAEVDSKPMAVLSRLAQLIASGEKRALTCLVLRVISGNAKHTKVFHSCTQGNPLKSLWYRQARGEAGCSARKPGVWKRCLYVTHVRQRQLGIYMSNWHFAICVLFPCVAFWSYISVI